MYADIEFVYRPKKQDVDNNTGKSVMYIVKKVSILFWRVFQFLLIFIMIIC